MNTAVTKHSVEKVKERLGVNRKYAEKRINDALRRGKTAEDFSSWERSCCSIISVRRCAGFWIRAVFMNRRRRR